MTDGLEKRLRDEGLLDAEARRKRELFTKVEAAFRALGGAPSSRARRWFVPGRIEVLGKHTDYAGGRSLVCAIGRGICLMAAPRADPILRIADAGRDLAAEVPLDPGLLPSATGWVVYAQTVASRLAQNFPGGLQGADVALASDLPRASGLSSSSALVVALFTALSDLNDLPSRRQYAENIRSPQDLGEYLGSLENGRSFGSLKGERGVGTFGGSEDQTAILCCRAGELAQYLFCPVRHERAIRFPEEWAFVVAASGVAADKTGNAKDLYNRLSVASAEIRELWNDATGRADESLFAAATSGPEAPDRIRRLLRAASVPGFSPGFLLGRFEQFLEETTVIIPAVADRLARNDVIGIGDLVDRSQTCAERFLGNQTPETIALARSARELGAAAACAFGGGFGGSVWALVRQAEADPFRRRWGEEYTGAFPDAAAQSRFFVTRPGPALLRL